MTIGAINGGAGGGQFLSLASDGNSQGAFTSVSGELAVLMLESQEHQKEVEREQLASARHDFSEALADEVEALRDQADAGFRGAVLTGSLSVASSGLGIWGDVRSAGDHPCKNPWQSRVGDGLGQLSKPLGDVASKTYGAADAKSAEGAAQAAKWRIDDSRDALQDASSLQNKALDWTSSMSEREAATMTAILSNKV
jgi:hypothetical protein